MFRLLLVSLLSTAVFSLFGQEKEIDPNGYNKFYHDNGQLSSEGSFQNGKPEGDWKTYYETGVLKSEGNRRNHQLNGPWKFYNEDGILTRVISYQQDLRDGQAETYNQEGFLTRRDHYKEDKLHGESQLYFESGKVRETIPFINGRRHGVGIEYDEKGNTVTITKYENDIIYSREYINRRDKEGKKQGKWKEFYADGTVKSEGIYRDNEKDGYFKEYNLKGEVIQTRKFDNGQIDQEAEETKVLDFIYEKWPNGELKSFRTYREGLLEGLSIDYNERGEITGSRFYKLGKMLGEGMSDEAGVKQGIWREYTYPDEVLRAEGKYKDGLRFDEWKFFFKNGKLEQKGRYIEDELVQGTWTWYFPNGNVKRAEDFRRGIEDGLYVEYNDTGKVIVRGEFIDGLEEGDWIYDVGDHLEKGSYSSGQKEGEWISTYTNGNKYFQGSYEGGLEIGKHTYFYESGTKRLEGKYQSGEKNGRWKRYYEDGTLMLEIDYKRGTERKLNGKTIRPKATP